jgi:hypothetical protein
VEGYRLGEEAGAVSNLTTYFQTFKASKQGYVDITGNINVESFGKVNVMIWPGQGCPPNVTVCPNIGLLTPSSTTSGMSLGIGLTRFPLQTGNEIHSYEVTGPEFNLGLDAPANADVPVQCWVFLN